MQVITLFSSIALLLRFAARAMLVEDTDKEILSTDTDSTAYTLHVEIQVGSVKWDSDEETAKGKIQEWTMISLGTDKDSVKVAFKTEDSSVTVIIEIRIGAKASADHAKDGVMTEENIASVISGLVTGGDVTVEHFTSVLETRSSGNAGVVMFTPKFTAQQESELESTYGWTKEFVDEVKKDKQIALNAFASAGITEDQIPEDILDALNGKTPSPILTFMKEKKMNQAFIDQVTADPQAARNVFTMLGMMDSLPREVRAALDQAG